MVTFVCDTCQDSITKPKVKRHLWNCPEAYFICVDCHQAFDSRMVHSHTSCITEEEKDFGKFARIKNKNKGNTNNKPKAKSPKKPKKKGSKRAREEEIVVEPPKKKRKAEKVVKDAEEEEQQVNEYLEKRFKWRKSIKKVLNEAEDKQLSKKQLRKKMLKPMLAELESELKVILDKKLSSSKFVVDGNSVSLKQ
eukprot:TRINITY_DN11263_c0_g1_i1.p1 TRINITY_DN11263_c0_g1~~TRINITY_DN11263_c0_g1_i1.p1  ORF type:complete len:194 (+),score=55.25 TRINITY_DN11263_c0_g1_i1:29-610(+)